MQFPFRNILLCQRHSGNPAGPSLPSAGLKTARSCRAVWGGSRPARRWADRRAGCRQSRWKMRLTHVLSSRNTSLLMAWQLFVPRGPAVPRPSWGGAVFGGLLPLRRPRARAGQSVSPVLSPGVHPGVLQGRPGKGHALRQRPAWPLPGTQTPCPQAEPWSPLGNKTACRLGRRACPSPGGVDPGD